MEHWMVKVGEPPMARLLLKVDEAEAIFYRRFVERHGGAFVALRSPKGSYRLDFPPGTRVECNEGYEPHDSYCILYPDGVALTWYRMFKPTCCSSPCPMMMIGPCLMAYPNTRGSEH
jgi:hypothetical protein